jgi:hypothetical protein
VEKREKIIFLAKAKAREFRALFYDRFALRASTPGPMFVLPTSRAAAGTSRYPPRGKAG